MRRIAIYLAWFVATYLAVAIWQVPAYLTLNFGQVTFSQILFYLVTEDGTVGTDPLILMSALEMLAIQPLVIALVVTLFASLISWVHQRFTKTRRRLTKTRPISVVLTGVALTALPVAAAYNTLATLGGVEFFSEPSGPDHFSRLYVEPPATWSTQAARDTVATNQRPLNLILLYVESLETTFSDKRHFPSDLNAPLHEIFNRQPIGIREMAGTNWTMAGMVASQCAIPLATFIWNKAEFKPGAMLGKAKCLGDYLRELGYQQRFLVGPDLKFAGMDKFYLNHGFQQASGKSEWLAAGMSVHQLTGWGGSISDDTLLELALKEILALHAASRRTGEPFNVTIITTDNHAPDGYLSPRCPASTLSPSFARVIDCTNQFVVRFYDSLKQANVLEDTVFVVMGDHLFMNTPNQDHYFPARNERRVFFNFLSPGAQTCVLDAQDMTHFDVAPTLLGLLTNSSMRQMGLGDNLCQPVDNAARKNRNAILEQDIASHSKSYRLLW